MCSLPTMIHEDPETRARMEKAKATNKDFLKISIAELTVSYSTTA